MTDRRPCWAEVGLAFALAAVLAGTASAEAVATVVDNGDPANRVDIVFLGDGYTAAQMGKYALDVERFAMGFFWTHPFGEYRSYFNVHRIDVVSPESGADNPYAGIYRNTALDASYGCMGVERGLCVDDEKVRAVLGRSAIAPTMVDIILVVVNDPKYGGSGGFLAVFSTHPAGLNLAVHEMGHSFGHLGDEYGDQDCPNPTEPPAPNLTTQTNRGSIKWNQGGGPPEGWIDPSTAVPTTDLMDGQPGLYEGGGGCRSGRFRPTRDSMMRTLGNPFDPVNAEQLILRVYDHVNPIENRHPSSSSVRCHLLDDLSFSVDTLQNAHEDVRTTWQLNGVIVGFGPAFYFNPRLAGIGVHTLRAETRDQTPYVRYDPLQLLGQATEWQVAVTAAGDVNTDGEVDLLDLTILQAAVTGTLPPGLPPAACPACGDLDGDGRLTATDVALFAAWFAR